MPRTWVPICYGTQMLKIVYEYLFFKFRITYIYIWLSLSKKSNCKKKILMHSIYDPWSSYEVFFSVLLRINVIRLHETFMQLWLKILSKAALQNLVHLGTFFLAKCGDSMSWCDILCIMNLNHVMLDSKSAHRGLKICKYSTFILETQVWSINWCWENDSPS